MTVRRPASVLGIFRFYFVDGPPTSNAGSVFRVDAPGMHELAEGVDMAQPDVFALKSLGLDDFIFADVGIESNGSRLTVLSALARLGKDPWEEAARWAREPKAEAIESLRASIVEMPLSSQAIHSAHSTASRLISLLPTSRRGSAAGASSKTVQTTWPKCGWMMLGYACVYLAFSVGMALSHRPHPSLTTPGIQTAKRLR